MRTSCLSMSQDEMPQASESANTPETAHPSQQPSQNTHGASIDAAQGKRQSMQTLEELRQKMKDRFVHQHSQVKEYLGELSLTSPDIGYSRQVLREMRSTPSTPLRPPTSPQVKSTTNSHKRASSQDMDSSYPFPSTISQKTPLEHVTRSREDHRMFNPRSTRGSLKKKLGKQPDARSTPERTYYAPPKREFLPSDAANVMEDPTYPSPNLYDLALYLNGDAGLEGWWSNVSQILRRHYGAERASLAVPGDVTDLENVPWGQKATYSLYAKRSMGRKRDWSEVNPEKPRYQTTSPIGTKNSESIGNPNLHLLSKRPQLTARHSFAGHGTLRNEGTRREAESRTANPRPGAATRRKSESGTSERPTRGVLNRAKLEEDSSTSSNNRVDFSDESAQTNISNPVAAVFQVPRSLELEPNSLIKRTGIAKLFGRAKPAVLTRQYAEDPSSGQTITSVHRHKDVVQTTPREEHPSKMVSSQRHSQSRPGMMRAPLSILGEEVESEYVSALEAYEEYEQVPPSPWSQSPAPSPAPLAKPDENPFFTNPEVDEDTFASSPPPHDYSETQPLQAIGVDSSKTVIHIPLLYSPPSKPPDPTTLRFPVAIISLLAPIVPYPSNLRVSLAYLMPHLTTSFCLAQKYSQLEKQLSNSSVGRYSQLLGLGGTFSDEGSELELVAGLTGQVNPQGENASAGRSSISSPAVASHLLRSASDFSTSALDLPSGGLRKDIFLSPGPLTQTGVESTDSYFKSKRPGLIRSQHSKCSRDSKPGETPSSPSSPALQQEGGSGYDELTPRDTSSISDPSQAYGMPFSRHSSSTSIATQLHRDLQSRPFSDTIAQLILNSVPLHLFLAKSPTGEVIWTNTKFDTYRRYPQGPRIKDPFQNVHSSEYNNVITEWTKALRTGSQFTERVRVRRLNDETSYRWFIFRANPLISSTGELLYWIGSFLDVHEQHIAELKTALERETFATDAKYRALANSIPQVVFEAAEYRGLISANQQWELYTGQSLEEAKNLGFAKYIHRDDLKKCGIITPPQVIPEFTSATEFGRILSDAHMSQPPKPERSSEDSTSSPRAQVHGGDLSSEGSRFSRGVTEALQDLVQKGVVTIQCDENGRHSYSTEIRFRSRKGDFRWHLVRLVKVETTDFGNGEASWYGTCTDINDRKILEKELNMAMQKLNREMESKTKFFTNMSHEIRTPLNGILGTIPFILDTNLDSDQRRMLETIQNSSTNLRELVDNILDVSKVEAGKMNILRQWFHVRSTLEDSIDTIASRAIDKGLELNYVFEPDVPSMVFGDRFRIRQILINLIGNAVKFTSQGEIFIRCSIHHDPESKLEKSEFLINFEVIDTGKGFSARDAQQLMQRFSQIENDDAPQHAGSGLGLFLSKQIAEMHGGRLTPTSMEGRGAKFSFYVKVSAAPTQAPQTLESIEKKISTRVSADAAVESSTASQISSSAQSEISPESANSGSFLSTRSGSASTPTSGLSTRHKPVQFSSAVHDAYAAKMNSQGSPLVPASRPGTTEEAKKSDTSERPPHPSTYSVLIICPFDYAREAIKQHIEQVVPLDVPVNVTSILDLDDWKELINNNERPIFTHLVLNLPDVDDIKEIMRNVLQFEAARSPTVVIAADAYMKRGLSDFISEFVSAGRKGFILPKPLKPSTFSAIFDPLSKRELSKDRNQATARAMDDSFKTMSKIVKEMIGNKGHRVLLVEDDETNRAVMLKYLEKVKLRSEVAGNGQECIDMVFSKEPGYYSLIICDIQMPVKDGYETCREIRSWEAKNHFPQIPIMALSANAMTDQIDDAARAGFNDYVTKPIKHNELGQMMMALLEPQATRILLEGRRG
ncbi:Histidine Kinase A (phosphoacceptor) domain containing protein [Coccidioides posadasii C735 delta SOWgp]|uniref:histidine kinase n=1 Tax=Coccidioides posadasii (strain C735) TaxID=222929 RepID=C5PA62_COCP7|nr:Histidine Kinase A (phosphoacceptor) domain containing protein [Coccidioides posadasii C735 delta SOWgp]EER26624.1 Histidine Kinase A (phosphoacceptor) domain containing protein [Coccidioides posadasii C735 delta SOWgp]|eukprot:XP_003068769.1 Histidine Kinase A (phosphoacceptor) domain containing protein [Coccidioides posadasii C735 delta SOWgp]